MRGLANLVLLLIGINTILSLSLPVIEGDIYFSQENRTILNTFPSEDEDDALGLQDLEMEPQFELLNAGKFVLICIVTLSFLFNN